MTTVTAPDGLIQGATGRWLGRRGIFRHYQPDIDAVQSQSKTAPDEVIFHTMSTAVSGQFSGTVIGELVRWVSNGDFGYEVRINGVDNGDGVCDAAAFTLDEIWGLAKVASDLRYEWEQITGLHDGVTWSVL